MNFYSTLEFTLCYSQTLFYLISTTYDTDMTISLILQVKKKKE